LPWPKGKWCFIYQDSGIPLPQLNLEVAVDCALAGKSPPLLYLLRRKPLLLRPVYFRLALQHTNAAASAPPLTAAGKLNSLLEQQVAQRGSCLRTQLDPGGPKNNPMG
jgi:hypothetical protein